MPIYTIRVDSDGSGDGETTMSNTTVTGLLMGVRVTYGGTPDAGTDVTITESRDFGRTLLTRANTGTAGIFYPQVEITDGAGAGLSSYVPIHLTGAPITVTIADAVIDTVNAVVVQLDVLGD